MKTTWIFAAALVLCTACASEQKEGGGDDGEADAAALEKLAERGQDMFRDRGFGEIEIACIDCHADFDKALAGEDRIRPGHSILGAHKRVETWNGEFSGDGLQRTAAGAAKCAWLYQEKGGSVEDALSEDEAAALMAYYAYVSPGNEAPVLNWDAVTWPGDPDFTPEAFEKEIEAIAKLRGTAARGEAMFDRACAPCHDTGIGPATRIIKRKAADVPATVRGGEDSMPFFSRDKLSDQDIADIQEFLSR
ncbi:MAG: cytochrome c [Bacteroidota bacterium]|nr:cytochrome c [Bacteroidota bacterium]